MYGYNTTHEIEACLKLIKWRGFSLRPMGKVSKLQVKQPTITRSIQYR